MSMALLEYTKQFVEWTIHKVNPNIGEEIVLEAENMEDKEASA